MTNQEPPPHTVPNAPGASRGRGARTYWGASTGIGLVLPLMVYGLSAYLAFSWRAELPDLIATHWGSNGPDGFSSLDKFVYTVVGAGIVLCVVPFVVALRVPQVRKIMTSLSLWLASFFALILLGSLWVQRELTDPSEAGGIGAVLVIALAGSLALGVLGYWLNPSDPPQELSQVDQQEAIRLAREGLPAQGAATAQPWETSIHSKTGMWIGGSSIILTVLLAVMLQDLWLLIIPVLLGVVIVATSVFQVRIDAAGLSVRSVLGWPRKVVPLAEVRSVQQTTTDAFSEFGGWGWRVKKAGHTGIIMAGGPSLTVQYAGPRTLVVTMPDAAAAATATATLNAYVAQQ